MEIKVGEIRKWKVRERSQDTKREGTERCFSRTLLREKSGGNESLIAVEIRERRRN